MLNDSRLKNLGGLYKLPVVLLVMLVSVSAWSAVNETIAQLRLDYAAFRAAEDDYRAQRQFNGLDGAEAADYATYIARLQRRVFEDCQAVINSGSSFPEDLPCPVNLPPATKSADIATEAEQTNEEQIAALDRMLNSGLGEYDEKLLREQERIKAATPNNNSDGADGSAAGQGDGSEGDGSEGEGSEGQGSAAEGRNTGGTPGDNREGEQSDGQRAGGTRDSSTGSGDTGNDSDQPTDIPDGSDDDVVARQLREAAEKETDPELKAKLWEEYRRYKRGTN
jgi:hypothetical protein